MELFIPIKFLTAPFLKFKILYENVIWLITYLTSISLAHILYQNLSLDMK